MWRLPREWHEHTLHCGDEFERSAFFEVAHDRAYTVSDVGQEQTVVNDFISKGHTEHSPQSIWMRRICPRIRECRQKDVDSSGILISGV